MWVEIPMNLQRNGGPRMLNIPVPDDNINSWDSPIKVLDHLENS
jgi:hypothetical protein